MGHCDYWHDRESVMDYVSEVVFFCDIYRNGMGVCGSVWYVITDFAGAGVFMAAGRRHYLYDWRCNLCVKAADF